MFKNLIESGASKDGSPSKRRVIILSNYIALTLTAAIVVLYTVIPANRNAAGLMEMALGIAIFTFPILLNRWHFTVASRLYECWLPPTLTLWYITSGMRELEVVSIAHYDGLRFYLLATSCIPYLLLERKNAIMLLACILPGFIAIIFCDPILEILGVGIHQKGIPDSGYEFTPIRSFAAYLIINGCCLSLKMIVNASDLLNEKLYAELAEKNRVLLSQSEEKIRKSEHKYRSLFEQASDGIMITDLQGRLIDCNPQITQLLGYSLEELLKLTISDLMDKAELKYQPLQMDRLRNGELVFSQRSMVHKDGALIEVESSVKKMEGDLLLGILRDVSQRKKIERALKERIKELRTLYHSSQILQAEGKSTGDVLQEMVSILPAGWQYPEITAARIVLGPQEFVTSNYAAGTDQQYAEFNSPNGLKGKIEVVYLLEMPSEAEGPFLSEERNLINMLAEMLRIHLTRKLESDALKKSEASLNATINNTSFFIWSVDKKFELQNINKPFKQFIEERFGIPIHEGQSVIELNEHGILMEVFSQRWIELYAKAMSGESFELVEEHLGRNFKFSLNPIIENDRVTGVSVFSEETTELKRKERELVDAQKQIGDLKLMALRAAMNPHFIFNTLSSIQYYIMDNDKRNAVNYLSTFSKLIRGILNNSVQTRVKLVDELEMLKHYITLEQMRFENKFDFVMDVEQDLDVDNIEIPSMLIQPYVENAILHGINNKLTGRGILKIAVKDALECVLFEVEDNGIGRDATRQLQQQNLNQHKSFGTALTEERLKLINAHRDVSYETIDLEEDGEPAGTKVRIWVSGIS